MAYCTESELFKAVPEDNIIQLTDDENTGNINSDRVTEAILKADAIIDSYLRAQYTVPLTTVPELINNISVDLAVYFLYKRRRETEIDDGIRLRYTDAIALLKDINSGKLKLDITDAFATSGGIYYGNKASTDKIYTEDELDKYL